ncbi:hypothetical protein M9Y11_18950, partial [Clostridioides difficile]|nr:hypothetical protein [Clostridioides difficile]
MIYVIFSNFLYFLPWNTMRIDVEKIQFGQAKEGGLGRGAGVVWASLAACPWHGCDLKLCWHLGGRIG